MRGTTEKGRSPTFLLAGDGFADNLLRMLVRTLVQEVFQEPGPVR